MVTTLFSEALKPHWNKSERRRKPPGGFSADRASCSQGEGRQDGNRRHSWGRRWRLPIRACWTKKQIEIVFLFCKSTKHEKLSKEAVRSCVQRLCIFFLPHCQRINITKWGFCIKQRKHNTPAFHYFHVQSRQSRSQKTMTNGNGTLFCCCWVGGSAASSSHLFRRE